MRRKKAERETGVNEEDVGRPNTINSITGHSTGWERGRGGRDREWEGPYSRPVQKTRLKSSNGLLIWALGEWSELIAGARGSHPVPQGCRGKTNTNLISFSFPLSKWKGTGWTASRFKRDLSPRTQTRMWQPSNNKNINNNNNNNSNNRGSAHQTVIRDFCRAQETLWNPSGVLACKRCDSETFRYIPEKAQLCLSALAQRAKDKTRPGTALYI